MWRIFEKGGIFPMICNKFTALAVGAGLGLGSFGGVAFADSIDPLTYSDELAVGESVTIRKTVTVDELPPTDALIDIHFLFDTSGSMGDEIDAAKAAASDIFTALSAFGDVAASVGVYSEAARLVGATPGLVINSDLTTDIPTAIAALDAVTLSIPDGGGDGPENGNTGIELAVENLSWRPASNRFVFTFGDYGFKTSDCTETYVGSPFDACDDFDDVDGAPISTFASAEDALDTFGVDLFGLQFTGNTSFTGSIEELGGTAFETSATTESIVASITAGIVAGFEDYSTVTVDDLGGGLPEIDVSVACVSADIGACVGADAVGVYDRSVERDFEFDVTFTRLAEGDTVFPTFALVDGSIVAREIDTFTGPAPIPLPAAGWLLIGGIAAFGAMKRRGKKAA
jgi:hypothetical protein